MNKTCLGGLLVMAGCVMINFSAMAQSTSLLSWGDGGTFRAYDHNSSLLVNNVDGFTASLVQLIYAGADGVIGTPDNIGDGLGSVDDTLVAYSFIGDGYFATPVPALYGIWTPLNIVLSTADGYANNNTFYIRVWEGISSDYSAGTVPSSSLYYGDSALITLTSLSSPIQGTQSFYLQSDLYTTSLAAVPEPSTMALMALGMASVGLYRRRKKSL